MNIKKKNSNSLETKQQDFLQPEPVQVEEKDLREIAAGRMAATMNGDLFCA